MKASDSRELGVGVVYSPRLARVLDLELIDVLEVEPQMFWYPTGRPDDPVRLDLELFGQLEALPQHKLVHSVTLPIGNSRPHPQPALERLRQSVVALGAPYATEHLSFDRYDGGAELSWTGFLLPPKQDEDTAAIAAARIDEMRTALRVPVAFETGVNYLQSRADELSDGCFVRRVAEMADCGILLDLHNLLTNERNGRDPLNNVLSEVPLERVWEIHLAGGMEYRGYWLDSHSSYIEDELFERARSVVAACPNLRAIVFEIMAAHIGGHPERELIDTIKRMRTLWSSRRRTRIVSVPLRPRVGRRTSLCTSGTQCREDSLGALVAGRAPQCEVEPSIREDPAVVLYADLIASMREGVLHDTLPHLTRLLLDSIGPASMMALISQFHADAPPEPFGGNEARRFMAFVRSRMLQLSCLSETLDFEEAVLGTSGIGEEAVRAWDRQAPAIGPSCVPGGGESRQ